MDRSDRGRLPYMGADSVAFLNSSLLELFGPLSFRLFDSHLRVPSLRPLSGDIDFTGMLLANNPASHELLCFRLGQIGMYRFVLSARDIDGNTPINAMVILSAATEQYQFSEQYFVNQEYAFCRYQNSHPCIAPSIFSLCIYCN